MDTLVFDTLEAIAYAESVGSDRVFWAIPDRDVPRALQNAKNAFGRTVVVDRDGYPDTLLLKARAAQESGERVAFVTSVAALAQLRHEILSLGQSRVGFMLHVVGDRSQIAGTALSFLDYGLGGLFAARPQETVDIAFIGRRACEDASTSFFALHELPLLRSAETVRVPTGAQVVAFLGDRAKPRESAIPASVTGVDARTLSERQYKERVPFALGAASREYETLVARKHALSGRTCTGKVVLVGLGTLGDIAEAAALTLRRRGVDADAFKLCALRPYDGARVVKAIARADAVLAVEWENTVLAQSGHLAREIKAAFADAITWAPGYPGISSVPRVVSCGCSGVDVEPEHLCAAAMYAIEHRDARALLLDELDLTPPRSEPSWADAVSVRAIVGHGGIAEGALDAALSVFRDQPFVYAAARKLPASEGDAYALDLVVSRAPAHPHAIPTAFDVILTQNEALATSPAMGRLARGGECVVLSSLQGSALAECVSRELRATVAARGGALSVAAPFQIGTAEEGPGRIASAIVELVASLVDARWLVPRTESASAEANALSVDAPAIVDALRKRSSAPTAGNAR